MDIFEMNSSSELTVEMQLKMHALTCASRVTSESVAENAYLGEVGLAADRTVVLANRFYEWLTTG